MANAFFQQPLKPCPFKDARTYATNLRDATLAAAARGGGLGFAVNYFEVGAVQEVGRAFLVLDDGFQQARSLLVVKPCLPWFAGLGHRIAEQELGTRPFEHNPSFSACPRT